MPKKSTHRSKKHSAQRRSPEKPPHHPPCEFDGIVVYRGQSFTFRRGDSLCSVEDGIPSDKHYKKYWLALDVVLQYLEQSAFHPHLVYRLPSKFFK